MQKNQNVIKWIVVNIQVKYYCIPVMEVYRKQCTSIILAVNTKAQIHADTRGNSKARFPLPELTARVNGPS